VGVQVQRLALVSTSGRLMEQGKKAGFKEVTLLERKD
jgi:hypothetical protein